MVKDGPLRMNKRKALSSKIEPEIGTTNMDFEKIVWQTPANPPERKDYIRPPRHVKPYYFEFISHVNEGWNGKTVVDLFTDDAVKCGRIKVDGKMVDVSYLVRNSQKITHFLHRHEPPVMAWDIPILLEEPDVVVICKPASIPAEHGLAPLFRIQSNCCLWIEIMAREVQKEYIARVIGVFPKQQQVVSANVDHDAREQRSTAEVDTNSTGKSACTKFTRIRVHLQHLGHPIANDVLYLSKDVAPRSGQATGSKAASTEPSATSDIPLDNNSDAVEKKSGDDFSIDPMCTNCPDLAPKGYGEIEEALWLHCAKYSAPGWAYECPYPDWALLN
ncbi:hypothetical protein MKX01_029842 [Papaver californicum]|nr:hypothetical protein MKX01_029842 [Papaver californicum]